MNEMMFNSSYCEWKDLEIFRKVERLSNLIWDEVIVWDNFSKNTLGKQLVRAIDSVTANLEEADGRFSYKDKIRMAYIARGSLKEARRWMDKAVKRELFSGLNGIYILNDIEELIPKLNAFIYNQKKRFKLI